MIPSKENESRGRPVPFDHQTYRRQDIIERLTGWLKEWRRIFSRFAKRARHFAAFLALAFIMHYLRLATQA